MNVDVRVVGAGPAGLSIAAALAERGLSVTVVATDPRSSWHANFGCWADELDALGVDSAVEGRWERALLHTDGGGVRSLGRTYVRLNTAVLQGVLLHRCEAAGVTLEKGTVEAVAEYDQELQQLIVDGRVWRSRLVIDASGTRGLRPATDPAVQVAWGELVRVDGHPWSPGEMVLMDWRRLRSAGAQDLTGDLEAAPTFLYALPFDAEHVFVEETSLAARPGMSLAQCKARLAVRRQQLGLEVLEVLEVERCSIDMGGVALTRPTNGVVAFGAAGGLVHPATGYSFVASLRRVPLLADTIVEALGIATGTGTAQAAFDAMWPSEARRCRALHAHGLEVLLGLPLHRIQPFYDAFFSVEGVADWRGYMGDSLSPAELSRLMWQVFTSVDWPMRRSLMGSPKQWPALVSAGVGQPS